MQIALLIAYPLMVHLAILLDLPLLRAVAVVALASGIFYSSLRNANKLAWLLLLTVPVLMFFLVGSRYTFFLFYLPPIVVPLLVGWGFIRTLLPGQIPLVTAIGENSRGPLSPDMVVYTRHVTEIWSIFLLALGCAGLLLPIFGSLKMWSLFTNIISPILISLLFVGEYLYRKNKFRDHDHPSFREYLKIVFRARANKE